MNYILKYGLFFCCFFHSQLSISQDLMYEQYSMKDGLPSMQTYEIVQDSFGLLWIGTENGLVSFDGDEFVRYSHPDLLDNDILEVSINRKGRIYFVNLSGQLAYIDSNEVQIIDVSKIDGDIENVFTRSKNDYIKTRVENQNVYEIIELPGGKIDFKKVDIKFFNGTNDITYSLSENEKIVSSDGEEIEIITQLFYKSPAHNYVINDRNFRTKLYPVNQALYDFLKKNNYQRLTMDDGDAFIIDFKGLTYYDAQANKFYPLLSDFLINMVFVDSENNTWISTPDKGLLYIQNLKYEITRSSSPTMNINDGINDIVQDKNGNIYLGTIFSDIIINPQSTHDKINLTKILRPIRFFDHGDEIIVYNEYTQAKIDIETLNIQFNGKTFGLKSLVALDSFVYIGTAANLQKQVEGFLFSDEYEYNEVAIINARVFNIHKQEKTNTIYASTTKGLYRGKGNSFELINNEFLKSTKFSKIEDGDDNSLWVASSSKGIFNIKNDTILKTYNTSNGLISNNVINLEKYNNELFVSTTLGLCIIDLYTDHIRVINEFNFLPTSEVLVCKVIDDKYWIGTSEGITILSREDILASDTKKSILSLTDFIVNGVKKEYSSEIVLPYSENNIQLNLQHISFKSKKDKYIKYRIPLVDSSWVTTRDKNIRMPSLNPGSYHLEAVGVNSIGLHSDPVNIYFKIDKAWWNKTWVRILGILMLLGLGNALIIYRARRIRKIEKTKRDFLGQINKIKDQALQLQMNPHFIFNSLNAIQGFIGTDEEEKAMNYLARFARLIRLIFEYSKDTTITLEEELEFINLYLDLEKLRFKDKVNVTINIEKEVELNKDIMRVPPLLIQPIIENSFKHGLFHKKEKGNLIIEYSIEDGYLKIVIQDDGIGRARSKKIAREKSEKQSSSGIITTIERIDILNFSKGKKSNSLEIEDLYDKQGNAAGTKVIFKLSSFNSDI